MQATIHPLSGMYKAHGLKQVYYGPDVVKNHIRSVLPTKTSKVFIITGNSLSTKTPLIEILATSLGSENLAGIFTDIRQHAPVAQLDEVVEELKKDNNIDTIISVGGGSPIDSAKAIIFRMHQCRGKWLTHIAIPTTLSAAECTTIAGFTTAEGVKTGLSHPNLHPSYIFYDSKFGLYTPPQLFLSTGIRALDHAVELQYHSYATWVPTRTLTLSAIKELFRLLPLYKASPQDEDIITSLFLAAFASLDFLGQNVEPVLMLSHSLGYALGAPYGIPHGITSCLTLGPVIRVMGKLNKSNAQNIAAILPYIDENRSGDDLRDSDRVAARVLELIDALDLRTTLTEHKVERDQLDIITARALRSEPGKDSSPQDKVFFETVKELVKTLW